jgi:hypothetical protein
MNTMNLVSAVNSAIWPLASRQSAQWAVDAMPARQGEALFATPGGFARLCHSRHQERLAGLVLCHVSTQP